VTQKVAELQSNGSVQGVPQAKGVASKGIATILDWRDKLSTLLFLGEFPDLQQHAAGSVRRQRLLRSCTEGLRASESLFTARIHFSHFARICKCGLTESTASASSRDRGDWKSAASSKACKPCKLLCSPGCSDKGIKAGSSENVCVVSCLQRRWRGRGGMEEELLLERASVRANSRHKLGQRHQGNAKATYRDV
jgi:hypothetical protein